MNLAWFPSPFSPDYLADGSDIPRASAETMRRARMAGLTCAAVAFSIGLVAMMGGVFHIPHLVSWWPSLPHIRFNSALCQCLLGIALGIAAAGLPGGPAAQWRLRWVAVTALSLVAAVISGVSLAEHALGRHLGIDELLVIDRFSARTDTPGRMGLASSTASLLCAGSFWCVRNILLGRVFQCLALTAAGLAWFSLTSLLFSIGTNQPSFFVTMSAPAAVSLLLLSFGLLCLKPAVGLVGLIASPYLGSHLARRLLPIVLLVPVVSGGLQWLSRQRGVVFTPLGLILYASMLVAIVVGVVLLYARRIDAIDRRRTALEEQSQRGLTETRQALKRAMAFLETAPGGMIVANPRGVITLINSETERLFGYRRSLLIGQPIESILPNSLPVLRERLEDALALRGFRHQTPATVELAGRRRDGTGFPAEVSFNPLELEDEEVVIASVRDVTTERAATRALGERSRQLEEAQQLAHLADWDWNLQTGRRSWSAEFYRICGLEVSGVPPTPSEFETLIHPDDRVRAQNSFAAAIRGEGDLDNEIRIVRPSGEVRHVRVKAKRSVEPSGQAVRIAGSTQDITDQKAAEASLAASEERWKFALEGAESGVWDWNIVTGAVFYSPRLMTMLGYEPGEFPQTAEAWSSKLHPDDAVATLALLREHVNGLSPIYTAEYRLQCADGSYKWILDRGRVVTRTVDDQPERMVGTHSDITERKQIEERLRRSEEALRESQQLAQLGRWEWDVATDSVQWSPELYRIAGLDPAEPPPDRLRLARIFSRESWLRLERAMAETLRSGRPYRLDLELIRPDGTSRWVYARGEGVRNTGGEITRLFGTFQDLTELKRTELELEAATRRLRLATSAAQLGIWEWDLSTERMTWDEQMYRLYGVERGSFEPGLESWKALIHPDDQDRMATEVDAALQGERTLAATFRIVRPDGEVRHLRAFSTTVRDDSGSRTCLIGTNQDVTEQVLSHERLEASEQRFRSALEYSAIGIALVGLDGVFLLVNRALCDIVGYSEEELLERSFHTITHPEDLQHDLGNVQRLIAGEITHYHMEKRYVHRRGHIVWVALSVSLVRKSDGSPAYFVSQVQDVTQRRQAEEKLKSSLAEKEVLLKEVHHRVKNNMQIISSLLQLQSGYLRDPADQMIFRECQTRLQTMAMVHERLYRSGDFARIEFSEHLQELCALVHQAQIAEGRRYALKLDAEPVAVSLDAAIPLGLIAVELLTNVFKHAFPGRTDGLARVILRPVDGGLTLTVADNGVGLPDDFDLSKGRTLGLRLIRALAKQLRAEIEVSSEGGAVFAINLSQKALNS